MECAEIGDHYFFFQAKDEATAEILVENFATTRIMSLAQAKFIIPKVSSMKLPMNNVAGLNNTISVLNSNISKKQDKPTTTI